MKRATILLIAILAFTTIRSHAQEKKEPSKPTIIMLGTSEMEVVPDEIYIKIMLIERMEGKEKITIVAQEPQLKNAITTAGVDISNLSVTDAYSSFGKVRWRTKDVMETKYYMLKVNNAEAVGKVFEQLEKIQANSADVVRTTHSKLDSLKRVVRVQAITNAKANIDQMLGAVGEKAGKLLFAVDADKADLQTMQALETLEDLSNLGDLSYVGTRGRNNQGGFAYNGNQQSIMEFQKIKLESAVYVRYEVK